MVRFALLQVLPYSTEFNPKSLVFVVMAIVIIVLVTVFNKVNEHRQKTVSKPRPKPGSPVVERFRKTPKYKQELRAISSSLGFSQRQQAIFAKICLDSRIERPSHLTKNEQALAQAFNRELESLKAKTPRTREIEADITVLFTVREALENARKTRGALESTRSLNIGHSMTMITPDQEQYPVRIFENSSRGLICKVPRDSFGNELRLPRWSRIELFFSFDASLTYRCSARILEYESGIEENLMVLSHTDTLKPLPNRMHDRKSLLLDCTFRNVAVANVVNGKKTEHRFYPSGKEHPGALLDISAGGCSIKTPMPPPQNQYIEIQCNLDGKSDDTMVGKVISVHASERQGEFAVHVQFAKMPRVTMNRIFSLIYSSREPHR